MVDYGHFRTSRDIVTIHIKKDGSFENFFNYMVSIVKVMHKSPLPEWNGEIDTQYF